jgi:putative ABC transport system permease protein
MLSDDLSQGVRGPLLLLLAAAALVLLIACINFANLLLVRGAGRAREMAVRQALGASRGRLVSQLLVESLTFGVLGGALGVLVAAVAIRGIRRMLPAGAIARAGDIHLDWSVLAFAIVLSILSALLFGLWPALRSSAFSLNAVLRDGGRAQSGGVKSQRARKSLVIAEVALAVVLVISAGLVVQSLERLLRVDPGFRPEHAVTAQITLTAERYPDSAAVAFYRELLGNLQGRAGVTAAGATDTPPLAGGGIFTPIRLIGQPPRPPDQPLMSTIRVITPGFFKAAGMQVLAGSDIRWNEPGPSMVLSEAAAKAFWPKASVIGKQIAFNTEPRGLSVVGEVNDARQTTLSAPQGPVVYISLRRSMRVARTMTVVVRGPGDDATLVSTLRAAVHEQDPTLALTNVISLRDIVDQSTAQTRLNTLLLAVFAGAALLLAILGIYGVVSYTVTQRIQEIGIRVALGAQRTDVLRLVLVEGVVLACIGAAIGFAGALVATTLIQSWLFEIGRFDPVTFVGTGCGLIVVSLAACWVPARRATRADPLIAMRAS